jgi:outer membrane lipoprotein-sorting protein
MRQRVYRKKPRHAVAPMRAALYAGRMRVLVTGLAALLAPALMAQDRPNAASILQKVSDTYANAKQYRFAVKKSGEESGFMQIAVRKPNQFRLEADGRVLDGADAFGNVTMLSDGYSAWNYVQGANQFTKKSTTIPLLDTEPPEVSPETFVWQADAVFITRYAQMAKAADHAKLLRSETIAAGGGNADCYVFEIAAPLPGYRDTYTWWVDKKRYLVLREDTQPASSRRPSSSTVYTMATINEALPDDLFHFSPPPGAKQVDRFEPVP